MAFYRHLCERSDFQISVVTDNRQILDYQVPYDYSLIAHHPLQQRLYRTRFSKSVHSWSHLVGSPWIPATVLQKAESFGAEAVLTVAGSWSWTAKLARDVARKISVPLVGSFNDWWYYNLIRNHSLDPILERNFKRFYQQCDLALCTSEGMREALGPHPNAVILYPTGALADNDLAPPRRESDRPFTLAFAGNLGDWYGRMLEALANEARDQKDLAFKFFGSNASWSPSFDAQVKAAGAYQGQVSFAQLKTEMSHVDALLLLMGFDDSCAQIERTSFKTKFLDYLSFQKPILLWGPEYCSAVAIAREFDSAEICTSPQAADFLSNILAVQANCRRQTELVANAQRMYAERFHPDKIHQVFVSSMKALLANYSQYG